MRNRWRSCGVLSPLRSLDRRFLLSVMSQPTRGASSITRHTHSQRRGRKEECLLDSHWASLCYCSARILDGAHIPRRTLSCTLVLVSFDDDQHGLRPGWSCGCCRSYLARVFRGPLIQSTSDPGFELGIHTVPCLGLIKDPQRNNATKHSCQSWGAG
ncbi:hypothetical protein BX600DRAFT_189587 [Xylariales sp. PMI_506]|nr:hypothetical protein BX600DRAFT_189587 [Xylariales sp. PMI_506]